MRLWYLPRRHIYCVRPLRIHYSYRFWQSLATFMMIRHYCINPCRF